MLSNYVIISLETINDKQLIEKNFEQTYDDYITSLNEDYFIQNPFNEIICIGIGQLSINTNKYVKGQIYSENKNEKEILEKFWKLVEYYFRKNIFPIFVGANILHFELECIIYRTFKYINELNDETIKTISVFLNSDDKWEKVRPNYTNNYSKYLISLTNLFSNFKPISINTLALLTNSNISINKNEYEKYNEYYENDFNKILELNERKNLLYLEILLKYLKFIKKIYSEDYDFIIKNNI
jgi:hypothetical protein